LPLYSDPEGDTITITINEHLMTGLPSFVNLATQTFTIHPFLASEVGTHQIDVTLSDSFNSVLNSFNIVVIANRPPSFLQTLTD
jgi:hypothetical protein